MSRLSFFLALVVGCTVPAEPEVPTTAPIVPPPWPTPALERARIAGGATNRLTITLEGESARGTLDVRLTRGPRAASCDGGSPVALEASGRSVLLGPLDSATVCVRDAEGNVRATTESLGHRSTLWAMAEPGETSVTMYLGAEPLDDDVTAIVYVAAPSDDRPLTNLGCRLEAAAPPMDDPPEHCEADCAGLRIVGEIPRRDIDALVGAPRFDPVALEGSGTTPHRSSVTLAREERFYACVRTDDGRLVTVDGAARPGV